MSPAAVRKRYDLELKVRGTPPARPRPHPSFLPYGPRAPHPPPKAIPVPPSRTVHLDLSRSVVSVEALSASSLDQNCKLNPSPPDRCLVRDLD
eukprot:171341-Prorocentrum_minimum.AAC.1